MKRRALLLDRDGVIIQLVDHGGMKAGAIFASEAKLAPGIWPAMTEASMRGYQLAIVTNQPCIARGLCSKADYAELMDWLNEQLCGLTVPTFACFHDDGQCSCRKPAPGLILSAATSIGVAIEDCWMIGDRHKDIQAAETAGCRSIYVESGQDGLPAPDGVLVAYDGAEAIYMAMAIDGRNDE